MFFLIVICTLLIVCLSYVIDLKKQNQKMMKQNEVLLNLLSELKHRE